MGDGFPSLKNPPTRADTAPFSKRGARISEVLWREEDLASPLSLVAQELGAPEDEGSL